MNFSSRFPAEYDTVRPLDRLILGRFHLGFHMAIQARCKWGRVFPTRRRRVKRFGIKYIIYSTALDKTGGVGVPHGYPGKVQMGKGIPNKKKKG